MSQNLYLILLGLCLSLTLWADESTDKQKAIEAKISAMTKDKVILFSEVAYLRDETKEYGDAKFSDRESFKNSIVSLHHPFCTKDVYQTGLFIASFELKNKPTEKQIEDIVKHFRKDFGTSDSVLYFEVEKLKPAYHEGIQGQVKIIGYGMLDREELGERGIHNDAAIPNTYFTKDNFIPLSDE